MMHTPTEPHDLFIHPELVHPQHERGVFEVEGHVGGWRQWLAYDSKGVIRIEVGMHDRDVDSDLKERIERRLDELETRDREEHEA